MNSRLMIYESEISVQNGFVLYERHIPKGTHYPLHWHNYFEFEIIVSGKGIHTYNNTVYEVCGGSAYMMSYYDFHALTAITDITLYSIHFEKTLLDEKLAELLSASFNRFHCCFDSQSAQKLINRILRLEYESESSLPYGNIMIKNIVSEIVIEMIRKSTNTELSPTPPTVRKAMAFINENFRSPLSLYTLAKELSFSPNYLGHLLKHQTGMTFNEHLNAVRLKYACNLLLRSDMSIKEIAFESGYSTLEYFMYIFKKKTGITPGEFRKSGS